MLFNKVSFALTALLSSSVVLMSGCTTSPSSTASNTQQQTQNGLLVYGGPILTMQGAAQLCRCHVNSRRKDPLYRHIV